MVCSLTGRLALVTGAASGIGKSVCELFAKNGAAVVAAGFGDVSRVVEGLDISSATDQHSYLPLDVSKGSEVESAIAEICERYSRPPCIAVNSAGIIRDRLITKMTEEDFDAIMRVNLKGTFLVNKFLVERLIKENVENASIVNISSIVGKTGNIGQSNYVSSKAAVVGLTKTTALEFARYGVRCNAVLPGFIETAMTEHLPDKIKQGVKKKIPLERLGQPQDVAHACLFLASDQSRYITATTIEVAGGLSA